MSDLAMIITIVISSITLLPLMILIVDLALEYIYVHFMFGKQAANQFLREEFCCE